MQVLVNARPICQALPGQVCLTVLNSGTSINAVTDSLTVQATNWFSPNALTYEFGITTASGAR